MNYNPYAAPQQLPPGQGGPGQGAPTHGQPQAWEPIEVLTVGWNAFKTSWVTLFFTLLVGGLLSATPFLVGYVMTYTALLTKSDTHAGMTVAVIGWILLVLTGPFFSVGLHRIWIAAARGQSVSFGMLFGGFDRYFAMLGCGLLMAIVIEIGFLCCVAPGVMALIGLGFAPWFVVEQKMGPIDALKASWRISMGQKWKLLVYMLLTMVVGMAGEMACGIGLYAAYAIIFVGYAVIYLRLTGQASAPTAMAPPGYGGGYGGYGPPGVAPPGYGAPPPGGFGAPPAPGGGYGPPGR